MENIQSDKLYDILKEARGMCTKFPDKSYEMCKGVYDLSRENKLRKEEGYALIGMSLACRAKSEINKMLDYAFSALDIFDEQQMNYWQVRSLNIIAIAYFYNSMYEDALRYLLQALDLFEKFKEDSLLSSVLNNIGEVFRESGKYDIALEYYYKALGICTNIGSKVNLASLLNNIGEVHFVENKYDEAFEFFMKSYNILIKEKEMVILGEVENKLGKVHYINENYDEAAKYFFRALRRLEDIDNKFYIVDVLINIAKLEYKKGLHRCICHLESAIQYAEKTNAKKKLGEVYKILSYYYEESNNLKDALEYFKKYHAAEQEVAASAMGNKLEFLKIEFDHMKENNEFEKIKLINKRLEMEISSKKNELGKIQELNKILERKAFEDGLTGIPNRSYINQKLNEMWEKALLYDQTSVLFIMDIDNFKRYNDYWGHLEGDECLKKVVNCIKCIQSKRKDIFARFGGEEFIYYAKDVNYNQALELGNLIRNEVKKLSLKYTLEDGEGVVTISVGGVFGKASNFNNISDMIRVADKELYKAKNAGRNVTLVNYFSL